MAAFASGVRNICWLRAVSLLLFVFRGLSDMDNIPVCVKPLSQPSTQRLNLEDLIMVMDAASCTYRLYQSIFSSYQKKLSSIRSLQWLFYIGTDTDSMGSLKKRIFLHFEKAVINSASLQFGFPIRQSLVAPLIIWRGLELLTMMSSLTMTKEPLSYRRVFIFVHEQAATSATLL